MDSLLAIDIGNTNIVFGLFRKAALFKRYRLASRGDKYRKVLKKIFLENKIDNTIICSVVPRLCRVLTEYIKGLSDKPIYIIGKDILAPIKNHYRKPKEVGTDRLVNAYAGCLLYGAPLIIIDFGTAITFDIISKKREYLGGLILPGLNISLDALHNKTALLPKVELAKPEEFIGRDTKNSILSGIIYGTCASIEALSEKIKQIIGDKAKIIGTGGNITLISKVYPRFSKIDKDLTLKGLYFIHKKKLKEG